MSDHFAVTHADYLPYVTRLARKLSHGDRDTVDDLMQEAWLAILFVPEDRCMEERYIRTVMARAMYRWLRRERGRQVVVLEFRPGGIRRPRNRVLHFRRNVPRPHVKTVSSLERSAA
jgi:DNA-directed RNA polymerase specialized sigma24 family protein